MALRASFLEGKSLLITGVTGFVGKAILESILRDHRLTRIYCLVRSTKLTGNERLQQVLDNNLFETLRRQLGTAGFRALSDRIVAVEGDISLPGLGISQANAKLLREQVDLVIHSAATVSFNMPLKDALQINTLGTMALLSLLQGGARFQGFVHISTAYANANLEPGNVDEQLYPMPFGDPETLVADIQAMTQTQVALFSQRLLQVYPNSYTFTKALAEHLLLKSAAPVAIVRLAAVIAAAQDPVPGWIDGTAGISSYVLNIGVGILDAINAANEGLADLVPVDYCVNAIMRTCAQLLDSPNPKSITSVPRLSIP